MSDWSSDVCSSDLFVFEPGVLDYLPGDSEPLEHSPLINLARDGELFAYKHNGFWHPMDTVRDRDHLDRLASEGTPPWLEFSPEPRLPQAHSPPMLHPGPTGIRGFRQCISRQWGTGPTPTRLQVG